MISYLRKGKSGTKYPILNLRVVVAQVARVVIRQSRQVGRRRHFVLRVKLSPYLLWNVFYFLLCIWYKACTCFVLKVPMVVRDTAQILVVRWSVMVLEEAVLSTVGHLDKVFNNIYIIYATLIQI